MLFSVLFCFVAANLFSLGIRAKGPTPPTEDPFYKPPAGYEDKPPGAILRHRPVPYPLLVGPTFGTTGNVKAAFQILYRTTDGLNHAQATVLTLIVPHNANPTKLLSYQTFYNAADDNCSPSYTLQKGQSTLNSECALISAALRQGWYVTVSDYEGPDAGFTVGRQEGHGVLDGIRATIKSKDFSNISSPRVGLYGYSGGSEATEWAVELQPSYAPDLNIEGAAFGGLAPNLTSTLLNVNGHLNSNLIPLILLGFANQYPKISAYLHKYLKPSKSTAFYAPLSSCTTDQLQRKDIFSFFTKGKAILNEWPIKHAIATNGIMGKTNTPSIPLYVYKSTGDTISRIKETDELVDKYCADGASIDYVRNHFGSHNTELLIGFAPALQWLKDRLDGVQPYETCSTHNQNVSTIKPASARILGKVLYKELKEALDQSTA